MSNQSDNTKIDDVQHLLIRAQSAKDTDDLELSAAILTEAALIEPENWDIAKELLNVAKALMSTNSAAVLIMINFMLANYAAYDLEPLNYLDYPLFNRGWDLIMAGEMARGEELLRAGLKFNPEAPNYLLPFGYYLLNQRRYEEGISVLEKYNELYDYEDEVIDSIEAITWAYIKQDRKDEALNYLLENLIFYGESIATIYLRLVRLLDDNLALDAIDKLLFKLIEIGEIENQSAVNSAIFLETAKLYTKMGKSEKAIEFITLIREKASQNPAVLLGLGRAWLEMGSPEKALEIADQVSEISAEDPDLLALRAQALITQKEFHAALHVAEMGLNLTPTEVTPEIREETQTYFTAPGLRTLESVKQPSKSDVRRELLLIKVDALTGLKQYEEAIDNLLSAQEQYPHEIIFYRYAAALLLKMGKPNEALNQLQIARKAGVMLDRPSREVYKKIKSALTNG